jgi:hypothetical protein
MPVVFVISVVVEWGFVPSRYSRAWPELEYGFNVFRNVFYQGFAAGILSAAFWPGRKLLQALGRLHALDKSLASARTWVDGCHAMIAKGVPSPLDRALAHLYTLSKDRAQVREELQQLGYRARFRTRAQEDLGAGPPRRSSP